MSDPVDSKNAKPRPAKKAAPARKAAAAKAAPPRKRTAATKKPVKRQPSPFAPTKSPAPPLPPRANVQGFSLDRATPPQPDPGTAINLGPIDTRLVRIDPDNPHWPTVPGSLRGADWQDGNQTQISGYQASDGWVYIVADGFDRQRPVWLYRSPAEKFTDRNWWHAWGIGDDGEWKWDVAPTPLSDDRFGEISLREIDGKSVLSGFNADTGNIEVRVADDPTQVLNPDNSALTIVATQADVPQNYGGYIVPGSTLDRTVILVSQWNTDLNNPYNVQQFVVNLNR